LIQAVFYGDPDQYPPIVNGARLLARAGYSVNILARDLEKAWGVAYPASVDVQRIKTRGRSSWQAYLSFIIQVLRRANRGASILIGHDMHGFLPARLLAARDRRPLVYHCHDFAEGSRRLALGTHLVRLFERRWARTSEVVIVPDAQRSEIVSEELHLERPPLVVANAPLQDADVGTENRLREALRGIGCEFQRVVFRQGVIGPNHAIEATIHSLPLWDDPTWVFAVMGIGQPAYIDHLKSVAADLGVREQFAVLPPVGYDEVLQFTSGADVGHGLYEPTHINNTHIATASNKIMEYMACGVPVLVSDRPGLRDLVQTHSCGFCADESSPEAISAGVNALLRHPEQALDMGKAGRHAFETVFCYERQFAPVLSALEAHPGPTDRLQ
jgi:glycosyltransferase involved in cell wall biosynthesis